MALAANNKGIALRRGDKRQQKAGRDGREDRLAAHGYAVQTTIMAFAFLLSCLWCCRSDEQHVQSHHAPPREKCPARYQPRIKPRGCPRPSSIVYRHSREPLRSLPLYSVSRGPLLGALAFIFGWAGWMVLGRPVAVDARPLF